MTYSEIELQQIEKYASIYLKISDIAVILDIPADVLRTDIADRSTEVSKAYRRGKAGSKGTTVRDDVLTIYGMRCSFAPKKKIWDTTRHHRDCMKRHGIDTVSNASVPA